MKAIIIVLLLLLLNFIFHKLCISYYKVHIESIHYIMSYIPILNFCIVCYSFFKETYFLLLQIIENKCYKKNDLTKYNFKRFSIGYCLCVGNEILYDCYLYDAELKNLIYNIDEITLVNFKKSSFTTKNIFYCKNKKQSNKVIEKLEAYDMAKKMSS